MKNQNHTLMYSTKCSNAWVALLPLVLVINAQAQQFKLDTQLVSGDNLNIVDDDMLHYPIPKPIDSCSFNSLISGYLGHHWGATCYSGAVLHGNTPQVHENKSTSGTRIFVDGDITNVMRVTFKNTVSNFTLVDGDFLAFGDAEMEFNSNIEVINAPNGTPVQI